MVQRPRAVIPRENGIHRHADLLRCSLKTCERDHSGTTCCKQPNMRRTEAVN